MTHVLLPRSSNNLHNLILACDLDNFPPAYSLEEK